MLQTKYLLSVGKIRLVIEWKFHADWTLSNHLSCLLTLADERPAAEETVGEALARCVAVDVLIVGCAFHDYHLTFFHRRDV